MIYAVNAANWILPDHAGPSPFVDVSSPARTDYYRRVIDTPPIAGLRATLQRVWGYPAFLPLQEEAAGAVLEGRDSLVVLPTGGGKSLCYQAPAEHLGRLAVVVSPLIALMKDQVDALRQAGVRAAYLNSSQGPGERAAVALRQPVGPRLPPRVPPAPRAQGDVSGDGRARLHGDRHAAGP